MKISMKLTENLLKLTAGLVIGSVLVACGGGGGGGGGAGTVPGSGGVVYYPYETVYGSVCTTSEPSPGCTFNSNGTRVTVTQDPHYDRYGYDSDDLWYVKFDGNGYGAVYNDLGDYQYTTYISNFAGHVGGHYIGVGTTGLFWENVSYGTYWLGKNGVLYNANSSESNFGEAINSDDADDATDTNMIALTSESNKALVAKAAKKLMKDYEGFTLQKATAVASALNRYAVSGVEKGYVTTANIDKTIQAVFGVDYQSALKAVKDLQAGDKEAMKQLTNRSADALGLKPSQAQKFIKGMYKKALAQYGYDVDQISW